MKEKNIKLQIVLLLVFVVLAAVLFFLLDSRKNYNQEQRLQLITERYQRAYNTIYDQYKQLSTNIYSGIMKRYNVQDVYQKLLTANEEQKNRLRGELLAQIRPRYEELRKEGRMRQLHFHLQNNESFLRLHWPEKYGDNLTGIRETVNYVNTKYSPIDGFEEGRIFNGYRFVFPVTAIDQTHLGSVEISFGPEALTSAMMKQYFVLSNFFIKEATVKNKLFPGELEKNYRKSHHNGYLYDKKVLAALKKVSRQEMKYLKPQKNTTDELYANAHSGQTMSLYDPSIDMVFTTIPVLNPVTHEMIAFFTVRSQSDFFTNEMQHVRIIFSLGLLLLVMILSIFYLQSSKRKILEHNTKHLEEQVRLRTAKLETTNKSLENEIDERKQVQKVLRIERDNLNNIFEAMEDGVFIVNQQYDIQYTNPMLRKDFGSYEGRKCYEYFANRKKVCPWCKNSEVFAGKIVRWEWSSTKTQKTYDLIDTPLKNSDGSISKLEIFRDITDRKRAEDALKKNALEWSTAMDAFDDAICMTDLDLHLIRANKMFYSLIGSDPQDAIGKHISEIIHPNGEDLPCSVCMAQEEKRNTVIVLEPYHPDNFLRGRPVEISVRVVRDELGEPLSILMTMHDLTRQREVENVLREHRDNLEELVRNRTRELEIAHEQLLHAEKLTVIGSLSASIAHEFNNPLQGIMNIITGVARRTKLDEDDAKLMSMAVGECNRMWDLIKNLQDFNRPTSGRKGFLDIHAALDSLLLLGKKEYKTRKIIIKKRYAENMPQIMAVADQIKQVLLNLLNNATDASDGGGTITVETETLGEKIVIRIHDTGTGIKPEDKEHIFEPFFTTKPEIKGTGLGLSVSYGIIKRHAGEIIVDSETGKGTTFSVTLPIDGGDNAEQENPFG